jgi:peroxiredoxin (alkyl hydroperoxide reductase subunit C)
VLFSQPDDFTPVCMTEFVAFAKNADKFKVLNCELLGLSIDSAFAHIAWVRTIDENFGVKITFPLSRISRCRWRISTA